MKNIDELRKKENAIKKVLDDGVRKKLMKIPGVVHVSVGLKETGKSATDEFSIRVYVKEKKDKALLSPHEIVPKEIDGIKTDVNQVPHGRMLVDSNQYVPIRGGIQIRIGNSFGTLGCLAKDSSNNIVMVTCAHVGGFPAAGVNIFQPDVSAVSPPPVNVIGVTTANSSVTGTVDCAAHTVNATTLTTNVINNLSIAMTSVGAPVSGARVYKVGRTTGLTRGKIVDANGTVSVDGYPTGTPPNGTLNFTGIIKIQALFTYTECCCCTCYELDSIFRFSDQGDSGSAVVMSDGHGVGLLFADNEGPGGTTPHETYACLLSAVQTALNVTVTPTVSDTAGPIVKLAPPSEGSSVKTKGKGAKPIKAAKSKKKTGEKKETEPLKTKVHEAIEMDNMLEDYEDKLRKTEGGNDLLKLINNNRVEILQLINHKRPVTVIWHHSQGPAFTAHFMNSLKDAKYIIPKEEKGVTLKMLVIKMAAVLQEYGSPQLKEAIDKHAGDLLYYAEDCKSAKSLLSKVKNTQLA
jgi:hypothetical protein